MDLTIDTHPLVWYLEGNQKLSTKAFNAIRQAEKNGLIYIPIIVLMEILYLNEKRKISLNFNNLLESINTSINYQIIPFDYEILMATKLLSGLEMHDRIILATALLTKTPLITKDRQLTESGLEIIW